MSGASTPSQGRFKNVLRALTPSASDKQLSAPASPTVPPSPAGSEDLDADVQPPQFLSSFMNNYPAPLHSAEAQTHSSLKKSTSWLTSASQASSTSLTSSNPKQQRSRHSEDNLASPTAAQGSVKKVFGSSAWSRSKEALVGGLKRTSSNASSISDLAPARTSTAEPQNDGQHETRSPSAALKDSNNDETAHHVAPSQAAYHAKSTPGGPIHLGAGLSESSKRFRSAFRLKSRADGASTLRKAGRALVTEQSSTDIDSESSPGSNANSSLPMVADASSSASSSQHNSPQDEQLANRMNRVQLSQQPPSSRDHLPLRSTYAAGRLQNRLEAASLMPAASSSSPSETASETAPKTMPTSPRRSPTRTDSSADGRSKSSPQLPTRGEKRKTPSVSSTSTTLVDHRPVDPQPRLQVLREQSSPPKVTSAPHSESLSNSKPFVKPLSDRKADADRQEWREPEKQIDNDASAKPPRPAPLSAREAALDPENRVPPSRPLRHPNSNSALGVKQPSHGLAPRAPLGDVPGLRQKHASNGAPIDRVVPLKAASISPPEVKEIRPPASHAEAIRPSSSYAQTGAPLQSHQQHPPSQPAPTPAASGSVRKATHVVVNQKQYLRSALLGKGGSSRVYRITDREHNVFALKKVELGKGDLETYTSFCNEIELLKRLRGHDRIIQLVDSEVNETKRTLIMILEIGEIDLNSLLQEKIGKRVSMNFIRQTWEQMLEAVKVVHDAGIVHTDLKPANFVLVKGALKLIDFGIAKAIPSDTTNIARDQQIGTANYMSPEALCDSGLGDRGERLMKMGRPSDVWSLGCILYQMVYGVTPFGHMRNLPQKMIAIQNPLHKIDFPSQAVPKGRDGVEMPDHAVRIEADLLRVLKSCLRFESKRRSTIPQLLADSFLRREDSIPVKDGDVVPLSLEMVSGIVARTVQWSAGRMPARDDQQQFIEDLFARLTAGTTDRAS